MSERFAYIAVTKGGQRTRGRLGAANAQDAYRILSTRGLTPVKIRLASSRGIASRSGVNIKDLATLTRELSVLVEARIPLRDGLVGIAAKETRPTLKAMISDIASMIEAGASVSDAMSKYQRVLGEVFIETMRAAEKSGNLVEITRHLADMLERQAETSQMIKRAMAYPVLVLSFVTIAMAVIVMFVIPRFSATFEANGVELPMVTQVLQYVGGALSQVWWVVPIGVVAGFVAVRSTWRSRRGRLLMERIGMRLPFIGPFMRSSTCARFARVLSLCLGSGLDLVDSIRIGARATGRPEFVIDCDRIASHMTRGDTLETSIERTDYLPPFAKRLFSAGRDASELAESSRIVTRHFDRESDQMTKNIGTIVEPVLTIAMAVLVLMIALSVFLPMWKMVGVAG